MAQNPSKTDLIYSKERFVNEFATVLHEQSELSNDDFNVLLLYLSRDSGAIAYDGEVCTVVFFAKIHSINAKDCPDHQVPLVE